MVGMGWKGGLESKTRALVNTTGPSPSGEGEIGLGPIPASGLQIPIALT